MPGVPGHRRWGWLRLDACAGHGGGTFELGPPRSSCFGGQTLSLGFRVHIFTRTAAGTRGAVGFVQGEPCPAPGGLCRGAGLRVKKRGSWTPATLSPEAPLEPPGPPCRQPKHPRLLPAVPVAASGRVEAQGGASFGVDQGRYWRLHSPRASRPARAPSLRRPTHKHLPRSHQGSLSPLKLCRPSANKRDPQLGWAGRSRRGP